MKNRRHLKQSRPFSFLLFFLILLGFSSQVLADSGPRPGKTNPLTVARRVLFDDNELLLMVGDPRAKTMDYKGLIPSDNTLANWYTDHMSNEDMDSKYGTDNGTPYPCIKSCSGRFTRNDIEQVAYLFPAPDNKHIVLELWDAEDGRSKYSNPEKHDTMTFPAYLKSYMLDAFDIAAADLDGIADSDGKYHDEIIVVRYYNKKTVVEVLNYADSAVTTITLDAPSAGGDLLRSLSVATGDFNGDGYLEIVIGQAVGQYEDYGGLTGNIIHFDQENGNFEAVTGPTWKPKYGSTDGSMMDISTGDFDGDGRDDIAMAMGYFMRLITVDDEWNLHMKLEKIFDVSCEVEGVKIISGRFVFDPDKGFGYNRRQIALLYSDCNSDIQVQVFIVENDFSLKYKTATSIQIQSYSKYQIVPQKVFDAVAGNFIGHGVEGKSTSPIHQLAVSYKHYELVDSYLCQQEPSACQYTMTPQVTLVATNDSAGKSDIIWKGEKKSLKDNEADYVMTSISAPDIDGDTYLLGNPAHIVVNDHYSLDYIIQEPPKHVDYLPINPGEFDGDWDVINVSAYSDFFTKFKQSKSTTVTTTAKNISSHSIGGSATTDVKQTVSAGVAGLISEKASLEFKAKLSYQYNSSKESWNSQYSSRQISFNGETSQDDFLVGTISQIDIWRFPVIGYTNPDASAPPKAYMEVILQGPYTNFKVAGESVSDWYHPFHQNHNILSYPLIDNEKFPTDLGSFSIPDGTNGGMKEVTDTMNDGSSYSYGGIEQALDIEWTEEAGSGEQKTYKHTLGESTDIKVGIKSTATVELAKTKTEFECGLNFNNKNSWGGAESSSCVNSESKGISIEVPSGSADQGYNFKPAVYITAGTGALKVAYATDTKGSTSGSLWWLKQYGNRPDPALNLPNRFTWHEKDGEHLVEYWLLNESDSRMEMRGFFMRDNEVDKVTGNHELISGPPVDGETIRLCARIYNFALNDPVENVTIRFESIQLDDGGNEVGTRELVGETMVSLGNIDNGSDDVMKEVWIPWDTTGKASSNGYRFYVTVDPEDTIENELHEWCADTADGDCSNKLKHGNNEGFWPWGSGIHVLSPSSSQERKFTRQADLPTKFIAIDALYIEADEDTLDSINNVKISGKYRIRAKLSSGSHQFQFVNIAFYEEIASEKKILAIKRISVTSEGGSTWFRWTPKNAGISYITAEILGHDEVIGPEASVEIKVHPANPGSSWQESVIDELLE